MISAERAIFVLRRDLTISSVLKTGLGMGVVAAVLFTPASGGPLVLLALLGVIAGGLLSGLRRSQRRAVDLDSPSLIAAGEYDQAEEQIEQVIGTFWSLRSAKLMGLHQLAILRHAQRRWRESALLSGALLRLARPGLLSGWLFGRSAVGQPAWLPAGVARTAQLMLADSLIELGDLPAAHQALAGLYAQKLSLAEAMNLLVVQLEYEARAGAWASMLGNVGHKVQLAELLPAGPAARVQALLALAAARSGRPDLAEWLARRAGLLADANELVAQRPVLAEVFGGRPQEAVGPSGAVGGQGDTEVDA